MTPRKKRTGGRERTHRVTSTDWTLVIRSHLVSQCLVVAEVAASLASLLSQGAGLHPSHQVGTSTHLVTLAPLAVNLPLLAILSPLATPLPHHLASTHPNLPLLQATTVVRMPLHQGTGQASPSMGRSLLLPLVTGQAPTLDLSPRVGSH